MGPWQVRQAQSGDSDAIARVHTRAWDAAYRGLLSDEVIEARARERHRTWWAYLLGSHAGENVLVAAVDDQILGFAVGRPSPDEDAPPDRAEMSALYVGPDEWGNGIGGALLGAILAALRLDGFVEVSLWVLAENAPARRFYERRGFELDGAERVHPDRGARELRYRSAVGTSEP